MPKIYLLLSIGPVQEFLAAARKTVDLYAGSKLLSDLALVAIEKLNENDNYDNIIFPFATVHVLKDKESLSLPNRIFCHLDDDLDAAKSKACKAVKEVQRRFLEISSEIMSRYGIKDNTWNTLWQEQCANFIECYYAVYEPEEDESHSEIYQRLESYLGNRKRLRDFSELQFYDVRSGKFQKGQHSEKCAIILHHTGLHKGGQPPKDFWNEQRKSKPGLYRKGERLSAIATVKRNYLKGDDAGFMPVNTIAAGAFYRSFIKAYQAEPFKVKIDETLQALPDLSSLSKNKFFAKLGLSGELGNFFRRDAALLDAENYLNNERFEEEYPGIGFQEMKTFRDDFFAKIDHYNKEHPDKTIKSPGKYYAIISFDGDNMGKWLSGDFKTKDNSSVEIDLDYQKKISEKLGHFSRDEVSKIFHGTEQDPRLGILVYAGGDDILGFCAVEDLFDIVMELNEKYTRIMSEAVKKYHPKEFPTTSGGVAIAHMHTNLQQVLNESRSALDHAKETLGRDAIAFSIFRRSGQRTVGMKWKSRDGAFENCIVLKSFAELIRNGHVSTSFLYDLKEEVSGLTGLEFNDALLEIRRLLERHTGQTSEAKESILQFNLRELNVLYENLSFTSDYSTPKLVSELLMISQFLGRATNQ